MRFYYLATPYTKYPKGREAAFLDASAVAAFLIENDIHVYCPISHTHPVSNYISKAKDTHETWLPLDQHFMDAADGIIVCKMTGWKESYGVQYEIEYFTKAGKPVIYMEPGVLPELPADISDGKEDGYGYCDCNCCCEILNDCEIPFTIHCCDTGNIGLATTMLCDSKPTNPKDAAATDRIDLSLFPASARAYGALAMQEGDLKYGGYNYRKAGVLASVYYSACNRHLDKWFNGEEADPKTKVPHLASALACIGVLIDSQTQGNMNDNRPPAQSSTFYGRLEGIVAHLRSIFPRRVNRYRQDAM